MNYQLSLSTGPRNRASRSGITNCQHPLIGLLLAQTTTSSVIADNWLQLTASSATDKERTRQHDAITAGSASSPLTHSEQSAQKHARGAAKPAKTYERCLSLSPYWSMRELYPTSRHGDRDSPESSTKPSCTFESDICSAIRERIGWAGPSSLKKTRESSESSMSAQNSANKGYRCLQYEKDWT